jgi:Ala-tRNA(Pro) deacylase
MAINERLKRFLDDQGVGYEVLRHREAWTAREVAREERVSPRQVAKALAVREETGECLMVVLPAACRVDLNALRHASGRRKLSLVREEGLGLLFPDCEMGATPPFGQLYGLPVYVDTCFAHEQDVYFPAGNHREVIRMPYATYERLARPAAGEFCLHEREKLVGA